MNRSQTLLLDACVVINLYASGHMSQIVGALSMDVAIVDLVRMESLTIRNPAEDDANRRENIALTPLVEQGLIQVLEPTPDELGMFIDLTFTLDDGEAMTTALAIQRGYSVATDDRAAIRALAERVPIVSTLELVKGWADDNHIPGVVVREALLGLRVRGSYLPGRNHPLRSWWDHVIDEG